MRRKEIHTHTHVYTCLSKCTALCVHTHVHTCVCTHVLSLQQCLAQIQVEISVTSLLLPPEKNIHHKPPSDNICLKPIKMDIIFKCLLEEHASLLWAACFSASFPVTSASPPTPGGQHLPAPLPPGCILWWTESNSPGSYHNTDSDSEVPGRAWGFASLPSSQLRAGLLLWGPGLSAWESCQPVSSTNPSSAEGHELLALG